MTGCAPGLECDHCGHCGPMISASIKRAPGTCCPEPSCDYPRESGDLVCKMCGKDCRTCSIYLTIKKVPTCCSEPTCDHKLAPVKCEKCGAICPCAAWEVCREGRDYFANAARGRTP